LATRQPLSTPKDGGADAEKSQAAFAKTQISEIDPINASTTRIVPGHDRAESDQPPGTVVAFRKAICSTIAPVRRWCGGQD
jgi:hypothetical protein